MLFSGISNCLLPSFVQFSIYFSPNSSQIQVVQVFSSIFQLPVLLESSAIYIVDPLLTDFIQQPFVGSVLCSGYLGYVSENSSQVSKLVKFTVYQEDTINSKHETSKYVVF